MITPNLVYCSYPILGSSSEPAWVNSLQESLSQNNVAKHFALYRPWHPLYEQRDVVQSLSREPNPFFVAHADVLKIPDIVFRPTSEESVGKFLSHCDSPNPDNLIPYRDLYCLVRSQIVLADLSHPSYGETLQDVYFSYISDTPIIGITDKFVNSPIMSNYVDTIISPQKINVLIKQIVSHVLLNNTSDFSSQKNGDLDTTSDSALETSDHGKPETSESAK